MLAGDGGVAVGQALESSAVGEITRDVSHTQSQALSSKIVFLDHGIDNLDQLSKGLLHDHELVLLSPDQDGLGQISQVLLQRRDVQSVHIVAHGDAGQFRLGNQIIDGKVVQDRQAEFRAWSRSLTETADILIYGCDTGAEASGLSLIDQIAKLTGADVTASTDKTGAESLGGNWDLERSVGTIEAGLAFDAATRRNYDAVMPITIRAQGSTGEENMLLQIDGATVATFTSIGTDLQDYTYQTTTDARSSEIRVVFTNDLFDEAAGIDRNLRVDSISVEGVILETESPNVFSTGTWKPEDGTTPGFREDEFLHSNGYFQYPIINDGGGSGSEIELFAQGSEGTERFNLLVDGQVVATFDATTQLQAFSYTHDDDVVADDVRVEFTSNRWNPDNGIDENLIVDYITIDGTTYQTEDPSVFSTGTWTEADGITPGFRESEVLHSAGYFQYSGGGNPGEGSVIELRVGGDEGTEQFNLIINEQVVQQFDAAFGFQTFSYTHDQPVSAEDVRVEFFNDQYDPDQGIDSNLTVDYISIDGVIFQTEDPSVFSTGTWKEADGVTPGFRESETLHSNGYFQYGGAVQPNPGSFRFSATEYTADESDSSIQLRVDRVGGTDGVVSVEYATADVTTTQLEDYVPVVGQLTFGDGQESMLITIPIIQDPFVEDDETFNVVLSNATGGAQIDTSSVAVTITDDDTSDPAGLLRFERPMYMLMENMNSVSVKVVRDLGSSGEVTVDYRTDNDGATAGEDYTAVSGTLTFADGETEKTIVIPILEDSLSEDDERFWLYLENPTGGATTVVSGAQLIIMDNEPRPGTGDGLYAEYFDNIDFTGLARVEVVDSIDSNYGTGAPAGLASDTFSIRWTGQIESVYSEEYTFYTTSDDGVRLWINDELVIENWTDHAPTVNTGTIALEAGQLYDIRMDFYENAGGAVAKLEWSSASQAREVVPQSQLYSVGDFQRNGSTYALTPTAMTWEAAQNYAQRLGGNLVTVNDAAEEAFLQTSFGTDQRFWIGLNDVASEGNFVWASGEAVTYTNWHPGEPNNFGGNQDYAVMNYATNKLWDDDYSTSQRFGIIELTGDSLPSQNYVFGNWGEVIDMPNIAVAAAQLPDGEIVTWSSWDRNRFGGNNPQTYTSVFNTSTQRVQEFLITQTQHDMFCPGTVMLPDGRILVNGGGSTVTSTSVYDFRTDTWSRVENMNMRRWYNTSTTLGDGRVLTWGGNAPDGHTGNAEVYEDGVGWTTIQNMNINIYAGTGDQTSWHPQMFQAPNGKVFIAGPGPEMYWADVNSTGTVLESAGTRGTDGYSQHGAYVMYDVGKILKFGGADREANNGVVTNKAYIIDITGDTPVVTETGSMNFNRKFLNGLVLPDGRVMAIGGNTSGQKFSDNGTVYAGEIWDPATGQWSVMDSMDIPRNYHSIALLQADGTVFAAGGGLTGGGSADHPDAQVFRPDYLYNTDGTLADRPDIATVDSATYGDTVNVQVTDGQDITRFNLIRMSTVTHSVNTDQRLIPLNFSNLGNGSYSLDMPGSGSIAPPGFYMLYALNANGTPSEAAVINLA